MITAPIKPEISNSHHFPESRYFTIPTATEKKYRQIEEPTEELSFEPIYLTDTNFSLSDLIFSTEEEINLLILAEQGIIGPQSPLSLIEKLATSVKNEDIQEFSLDSLLKWAKEEGKEELHLVVGVAVEYAENPQICFVTERVINIEKETKAIALFEKIYGKDIT